jgi:hypothetical protein
MTTQTQPPVREELKKPYTPPSLVRHGDVRTMTRSGSGSTTEPVNSGQGSPQKRP